MVEKHTEFYLDSSGRVHARASFGPAPESIREQFERLADGHMEWQPQEPFPLSGRQELERLIAEVAAMDAQRPTT